MTLKAIKYKAAGKNETVSPNTQHEMELGLAAERNEMGPVSGIRRSKRDPVRGHARVVVECIDEDTGETKEFAKAEISEMSNTYPVISKSFYFILLCNTSFTSTQVCSLHIELRYCLNCPCSIAFSSVKDVAW